MKKTFDALTYGQRAALVCLWLTIAIAALALIGWFVQSRLLSGFSTAYVPMAPNTALCFLALALSLLLQNNETRLRLMLARLLALPVFFIASVRLIEILAGVELAVDSWFVRLPPMLVGKIPLARMAFFTASNFLFAGIATFLLTLRPTHRGTENAAGLLAIVCAMIGLAFAISYMTGTPLLSSSAVIPMALNTALAFILLGFGIAGRLLVADLERQQREGKPRALEVDRKILAGFGAALAAVFVVSIISYHNTLQAIGSMRLVAHTHEVVAELQATLSAVRDVESAARGFVITENDEVLDDFYDAARRIDRHMQRLRVLMADNPAQRSLVDSLEPFVKNKVAFSMMNVTTARLRGLAAAQEQIRKGMGLALMAQITDLVRTLSEHEQTLLAERHTQQERDSNNTILTFALLGLLVVLILAAIYLLVHRDLVGRQRAEEQLRRVSAEIHDLYNNAPCGYHSLNADGIIVAINDTELGWLGYTRDEVVGTMHITDLLTEASKATFHQNFAVFKDRGFVNDLELEMKRKDGSTFSVMVNATAIHDADGRYISSRSSVFDITERKKAEGLFQSLLEAAPDAIVIVDAEGRMRLLSRQVEQMFGYSREELYNRDVELLIPERFRSVHPRHRRAFLEHPNVRPMGAGLELYGVRKDGTEFPVEISLGPLGHGTEILVSAVIRDVTARKAVEEQIRTLNANLERRAEELTLANNELEAFSYSVSHDLRAPLRHIDGFADLLRHYAAERLDEKAQRYVNVISNAARQMGQLIDDLLVFSRVGRTDMVTTVVPLSMLVRETLASLQHETGQRHITWNIKPLPDVHGDPSLLRQVFVNLLSNAIKYTRPVADACIEVGALSRNDSAEHIIYVRDNGVGFDMTYEHKLFGVFQRLHTTKEFEGTGIGLANVRRIIARHGGRTWAEGEVGKGATFYFSLPRPERNA